MKREIKSFLLTLLTTTAFAIPAFASGNSEFIHAYQSLPEGKMPKVPEVREEVTEMNKGVIPVDLVVQSSTEDYFKDAKVTLELFVFTKKGEIGKKWRNPEFAKPYPIGKRIAIPGIMLHKILEDMDQSGIDTNLIKEFVFIVKIESKGKKAVTFKKKIKFSTET